MNTIYIAVCPKCEKFMIVPCVPNWICLHMKPIPVIWTYKPVLPDTMDECFEKVYCKVLRIR